MNKIYAILIVNSIILFLLYIKTKSNPNKNINIFSSIYIKDFESYLKVLNYHLEKAYDIIYKDRILIYSLEASKLNDKEFSNAIKDFLNLVLKMLGPNLVNEYKILYGNEETFLFNISEYFNTRFEDDEIRKNSVQNLSQEETLK